MQYSKWTTIANRHGEQPQGCLTMLRGPLALALRLFALLVPLGLAACADTITADQATSSATLRRSYEQTLSPSEQKAVISDLQKAAEQGKQAE
ncbi:MAG TPA: hypothetical protein VNJ31_07515 [Methyloceanibacter sp.]|nr:hypothetical protein [Methyloceanibacter sp.]